MPELRKDYILDRYVIIASERAKRPSQFMQKPKPKSDPKTCPFCPGNETMIPPVIDEIRDGDKWLVRAIPNKYKATSPEGQIFLKTDNEFYTFAAAYGHHEVIIETPNHEEELENLPTEHVVKVFEMMNRRILANLKKQDIKFVSLYKNRGEEAGASISHSHSQLIAYNVVPIEIKQKLEKISEYYNKNHSCPYCRIMHIEKNSYRRVFENNHFIAFTPYAARFPYEIWVFPKRHIASMTSLTNEELVSFAEIYKKIIQRLDFLNYPPYNVVFNNVDPANEQFHFFIEICPRLSIFAGFEYSTGTIIQSVPPEDASRFYIGEN